jgi:poly-gamma-glutamate synthase PgsB/CapB
VTFIYRAAMASRAHHVWIQCEALTLLAEIAPESFLLALHHRLTKPEQDDDIFVRRRAVRLLGAHPEFHQAAEDLIPRIINDPSIYVRQGIAEALGMMLASESAAEDVNLWHWYKRLATFDQSAQVRAAALFAARRLLASASLAERVASLLSEVIQKEEDVLVLKAALTTAVDAVELLYSDNLDDQAAAFASRLLPAITEVHQHSDSLSIRRYAALMRERIITAVTPESRTLKLKLQQIVDKLSPGKSRRLPRALIKQYDEQTMGRVLAVLSQYNFGFSVVRTIFGWKIIKGETFGFRLWRFLFELKTPSPDKRQGLSHTIGRRFKGHLRTPSTILSELTKTKVPGEPLHMSSESGWRPYLPLVDEALSCLLQPFLGKHVTIVTAEGTTTMTPPSFPPARWLGALKLTLKFSYYTDLRNWREGSNATPEIYIEELRKTGLKIQFSPYQDSSGSPDLDPAVKRFFAIPLIPYDINWVYRIRDYFFSVYENTLSDLAIFAGALLLVFVGSRLVMSRIAIRSRRKIELVIGGWGTRGKSGTERLKAALFEAIGSSQVSKSTGCEAMFLYAYPFGKTREMFLFRPYDKATIWEQYDLVKLATRLSSRIFLWECMALTPTYVRILQHQWMRDDYATITNTYPDHEDIQGPAGYNIPLVMTEFIPRNGNLVTTEEQMLPILSAASARSNTSIKGIGWQQAELIAQDVLERFPYEEHPYNIALVVALAEEMGIDPDFTVKEMADRVIADIGVLKAFPPSRVRGRTLQFINGMSANERFGTLSNWRRMEFDSHDPLDNPETIISTLINNRADRISRSQMFAKIVVEDLMADYHFLIGSNLEGMMGYILEALDVFLEKLSLSTSSDNSREDPAAIFQQIARRQRVPVDPVEIRRRLETMLGDLSIAVQDDKIDTLIGDMSELEHLLTTHQTNAAIIEETITYIEYLKAKLEQYQKLRTKLETVTPETVGRLDKEMRSLVRSWFIEKIVIIDDYHATGDQVIDDICRKTPPGLFNRIMGLQNIKGTGLDFVYRWQAWESCWHLCHQLAEADGPDFKKALSELSAFQEYGLLTEEQIRLTCETVQNKSVAQTEQYQAELALIMANMEAALDKIRSDQLSVNKNSGRSIIFAEKLAHFIEGMLDSGDAVKRRRLANLIYKDLAEERISGERAAKELKILNKRQKGGWLWARIQRQLR